MYIYSNHHFCILTGQIRAIKDCWIITDMFINDIYYMLGEANQDQIKARQDKLFITDYFNVKCYSSNPLTKVKEAPARLVNSLIHALHDYEGKSSTKEDRAPDNLMYAPHLLRFIIVIPDWDLIKHIGHYKFGISAISEQVIKWTVTNLNRAIETRRDDLTRVKPGAATSSEPKFVWVKVINRIGCHDKALSVRTKFNRILEGVLDQHRNHYIMDISQSLSNVNYFHSNTLNRVGAIRFWVELDAMIKKYELDGISLQPLKAEDVQDEKYKMPPPPPPSQSPRHLIVHQRSSLATKPQVFSEGDFIPTSPEQAHTRQSP